VKWDKDNLKEGGVLGDLGYCTTKAQKKWGKTCKTCQDRSQTAPRFEHSTYGKVERCFHITLLGFPTLTARKHATTVYSLFTVVH